MRGRPRTDPGPAEKKKAAATPRKSAAPSARWASRAGVGSTRSPAMPAPESRPARPVRGATRSTTGPPPPIRARTARRSRPGRRLPAGSTALQRAEVWVPGAGELQVLRLEFVAELRGMPRGFGGLQASRTFSSLSSRLDVGQHLDVRAADVLGRDQQDEQSGRLLSTASNSTPARETPQAAIRRSTARALPCGMAMPLPMPVDIMASRLSTRSRISPPGGRPRGPSRGARPAR